MSTTQKMRQAHGVLYSLYRPSSYEDGLYNAHKSKTRQVFICLIACGALCMLYSILFFSPRRVSFSYSQETCQRDLTLLPDLHKISGHSAFKPSYPHPLSIGSINLASLTTCFSPLRPPEPGTAQAETELFGLSALKTRYKIAAGDAPRILHNSSLPPQPISKPLFLQISQPDLVFEYFVETESSKQRCNVDHTDVICPVDQLGLKQGASNTLRLARAFASKTFETITETEITILPAVQIVGSSIQNEETIYTKPGSLSLSTDKPLTSANVVLEYEIEGEYKQLPTRVDINSANIDIYWQEALPREKNFRLTLSAAEAADGSVLDSPYVTLFKTSGGPKVTGVNIDSGGVAANARVIVTFDQPIASSNIANYASIVGGAAAIYRQKNQIIFALQNLPRCSPFTINIAKGLAGENDIASTSEWSHASRVTCRQSKIIGYSVKGRAIGAYYYGNGPTKILFTGGIHGSEPSSTYLLQDWAAHLDKEGYKIPADKQIVIVPSVNPDGVATNNRFNANGVNLDRNFPESDWATDIITSGGFKAGGGGSAPLSEPESQALAELTSSLRPRMSISFHAAGSLVGINQVGDSDAVGRLYASSVGYATMFYNAEEIMGYPFTGEYEGWIAEKLGLPAILIELPTHTGRFFSRHQSTLWKMVNL